MDEQYWQKLQEIFDEALLIDPEQQAAFLAEACDGDEALNEDLVGLLGAHVNANTRWSTNPPPPSSSYSSITSPYKCGDEIGHHKIIDQIGMGGMGVIFQAFDSRLQRNIALKFLPEYLRSDDSCRQRFMAEARAASKLDHPNICVIHDIDETAEGHLYITMPFYDGETLAARLKRGRLTIEDALSFTIQVADGLAAAHDSDIVHRDIKPANIMLTHNGMVKILDFGIAKVTDVHLTNTGMGVGTLAYMAPEQMHGQEVDTRADIWALGVTLYEMLTGQTAFHGEGTSQIVEAVLDVNSEPTDGLAEQFPEELYTILSRAMQRNRDARYESIKLMLDDCIKLHKQYTTSQHAPRKTAPTHKNGKVAFEWEAEFLDVIIEDLLPILGPITSKLVHRQAKHASSVEALCNTLCDYLPDDASKKQFAEKMKLKASMHTTPPAPNPINVSNPSTQLELSPVQLAKMESCLLPVIGPIAGSLIRRSLASTTDWDTVCQILTDSLNDPAEKSRISNEIKDIINSK